MYGADCAADLGLDDKPSLFEDRGAMFDHNSCIYGNRSGKGWMFECGRV